MVLLSNPVLIYIKLIWLTIEGKGDAKTGRDIEQKVPLEVCDSSFVISH